MEGEDDELIQPEEREAAAQGVAEGSFWRRPIGKIFFPKLPKLMGARPSLWEMSPEELKQAREERLKSWKNMSQEDRDKYIEERAKKWGGRTKMSPEERQKYWSERKDWRNKLIEKYGPRWGNWGRQAADERLKPVPRPAEPEGVPPPAI